MIQYKLTATYQLDDSEVRRADGYIEAWDEGDAITCFKEHMTDMGATSVRNITCNRPSARLVSLSTSPDMSKSQLRRLAVEQEG